GLSALLGAGLSALAGGAQAREQTLLLREHRTLVLEALELSAQPYQAKLAILGCLEELAQLLAAVLTQRLLERLELGADAANALPLALHLVPHLLGEELGLPLRGGQRLLRGRTLGPCLFVRDCQLFLRAGPAQRTLKRAHLP